MCIRDRVSTQSTGAVPSVQMATTHEGSMQRFNASQACISDASFAEVARMRKQECLLQDEVAQLRKDKLAAEAERDAERQRMAELEIACEARVDAARMDTKHALEVARIVRDENERLRKAGQKREEAMHKAATVMQREHKAVMSSSDARMQKAQASIEHQSHEAARAKKELRSAVEEHNMMAQEYYTTMERVALLNGDLAAERANGELLAVDNGRLAEELTEEGKQARRRLTMISTERDTLRSALEAHNEETRQACAAGVKKVNETLLKQTGELVATKARLSVAQREAEAAHDQMSQSKSEQSRLQNQLQTMKLQVSQTQQEQDEAQRRRELADAMVERLTADLGASKHTVSQMQEEAEMVQDTLRQNVDWKTYASEAFLEGSHYTQRTVSSPQPFLDCAHKHLILSPK
eukprot:TRINITY_DN27590_c0_g1_i2.p1 TRINITY_DN27590_c0_g1~~TRINITY_DN27590_c0_g1_i2.p1  ORF type:complete len:409 (-),score=144.42 TRINITY_DN27590_c0_g1_i2:106-1332(-)